MNIIIIGLFGLIGVYSRYFIDFNFQMAPDKFPLTTLLINLVGSFIAGIIFFYSKNNASPIIAPALLIGLCGGLTTFSSFSLQSLILVFEKQIIKSIIYLYLSPTLGILLAFLGYKFSQLLFQK